MFGIRYLSGAIRSNTAKGFVPMSIEQFVKADKYRQEAVPKDYINCMD